MMIPPFLDEPIDGLVRWLGRDWTVGRAFARQLVQDAARARHPIEPLAVVLVELVDEAGDHGRPDAHRGRSAEAALGLVGALAQLPLPAPLSPHVSLAWGALGAGERLAWLAREAGERAAEIEAAAAVRQWRAVEVLGERGRLAEVRLLLELLAYAAEVDLVPPAQALP